MCCIFTALVFLGPRFAILLWWLFEPTRFQATFGGNWVLPLLTFLFLPWTLLMYLVVAPFGAVTEGPDIQGFDWVWLGLAFVLDLASYFGGAYGNRKQVYAYAPYADPSYTGDADLPSGSSGTGTTT
jgi:hypothetical protein